MLVGTAWGATVAGGLEFGVALLALLATALVHCASNVINDVGDDITGTDRDNVEYIHPYTGGSRFITNGIMSVQEMHRWGWILIGMASVLGLALALLKGPIVIALGLAGIAIAWLYSAPAVQLSGKGVGEFFLMIAFGVLPVCGAAWLQSGVFDLGSLLLAIPGRHLGDADPVDQRSAGSQGRRGQRQAHAGGAPRARSRAPRLPAAARRRVRLDRRRWS